MDRKRSGHVLRDSVRIENSKALVLNDGVQKITKLRTHLIPTSFRALVMAGQTSLKYFSAQRKASFGTGSWC